MIVAFVLAVVPALGGIWIFKWILPSERRLPIVLSGGAGVGVGIFLMVQMALLRFVPVQAAVVVVHLLALPLAILTLIELKKRGFTWDISRGWTVLGLGLLSLVIIGTIANFSAGVWTSASNENLVVRMAMAAHMARSPWPPMDPYAPEFERLYRYTGQAWVAALMRVSGGGLFEATLAVTLVSIWAIVAGIFATVSLMRNYLAGLMGAAGFVMAAHSNFLGLWKAPFGEFTPSRAAAVSWLDRGLIQGFTGSHGFALVPGNDVTLMVALAAAFGGALLVAAMITPGSRWVGCMVGAALSFGSMAAASEHTLPVVLGVLGFVVLALLGRRRAASAAIVAGIAVLGAILSLLPQGVLPALVFGSDTGAKATFGFAPENFLTVPTDAMIYAARASPFFSVPTGVHRVSVLSPIFIKELGWILATCVLAFYLLARRRLWHLQPFLAAAIGALLIPGLFADRIYAINVTRFTALSIYLFGLLAGLVVAELALSKAGRTILIPRLIGVVLAILVTGSWVASVPLWPAQVYESASASVQEDLEVAEFVRALPYGRKALLLPGPLDIAGVTSHGWQGQHKYLVSFGSAFLPLGLDRWGNVEQYASRYRRAYESLDPQALKELGIDIVLTAPALLSDDQHAMVRRAVETGRMTLAFESVRGARILYFYHAHVIS